MRVIAGLYRGRLLKTLSGYTTRPTADKIKGAIFNMVGPYFDGGKVLDLYAGSGALAIEAISRGCNSAVLVDQDRNAQEVISENIALTREEQKYRLLRLSAEQALQQLMASFDLVFLDPPYIEGEIAKDLSVLTERRLLARGAKVVCETDTSTMLPEAVGGLRLIKQKDYGLTQIRIYQLN